MGNIIRSGNDDYEPLIQNRDFDKDNKENETKKCDVKIIKKNIVSIKYNMKR